METVAGKPRVLEVDLTGLARSGSARLAPRAWSCADDALGRIGSWSGGALALALLVEHADRASAPGWPLVIAVGECVRRGVPTAARATVVSRAPLSRSLGDGQVGGELAGRLASLADALVIRGDAGGRGDALVVAEGRVELVALRAGASASPHELHAELAERFGPCATLAIGVAGARRAPLANLAALSGVGADVHAHYVGRGGLGAVLGAAGLRAIAIAAPLVERERDGELVRALLDSPRLARRARGGTFELVESLAATDELLLDGAPAGPELASEYAGLVRDRARDVRGCQGCPTPCGWTFERLAGVDQPARFGASRALGLDLGLERFEDALELLASCDRLGLDAKEVGAALALGARARRDRADTRFAPFGDRAALLASIEDIASGRGAGALLALGAESLAAEFGLESQGVGGESVRAQRDLASLLGQCVSARGADPMRSFPFLVSDAPTRARLAELIAPIDLPEGAERPDDPRGKGRIVWWHENLVGALDASGFCAFSAAGLLADGACDLDRLARWIAPRALLAEPGDARPGERLIAMGDALASLAREVGERMRGDASPAAASFAIERLRHPGMLDEYRACRRLDDRGREREPRVWRRADGASSWVERARALGASAIGRRESGALERRIGRVTMRAVGATTSRGAGRVVELELPAPLRDVLRRIDATTLDGGASGRFAAAVFRDRRRVYEDDWIVDGDVLDLVTAIRGG